MLVAATAAALVLPGAAAAVRRARHPPVHALTLAWVGDIAFSSDRVLPAGGPAGAFAPLKPELRSDLTMGNLEGTLSTGGASKCARGLAQQGCFAFQAPPSYASGLRAAGFDLLNQANNHALDYGPSGQRQTIAALDRAGLGHTGRPGEIARLRIRGIEVAVLGFAPYPYASPLLDIAAARRLVRKARRRAQLVVVIIHAGAEGPAQVHTPVGPQDYLGENRGDVRRFAHAVIDAGAGIVLGSGPHALRGIERYRNRLIAYSLGDFAGPGTLSTAGVLDESAILRVTVTPGGRVLRGRWVSLRLVPPGLPRLDPRHSSVHLVAQLSRHDFKAGHFVIHSDGRIQGERAA